ncbi:RNA polymerase sigma factor [Streptacidiphilus sp. EB129]|uniref:RNA polymerase sigma factor n=1 Tax=Streptacidiphilus sp. EB129 TaxID=3156262 RepID=UPI00351771D7
MTTGIRARLPALWRRAVSATSPGERPGATAPQTRQAPRPTVLPTAAYADWDAIYADNVDRIYRQMFAKVGNRPDAEDLTSQVFLDAMGPLRTTASIGEVRSYLLATARTVLIRHWRNTLGHQVTEIDLDQLDLEDFTAPTDTQDPGRTPERITTILSGLSERHRMILTLRFLRGYTIKGAAEELGISVANAKVLQHRALRKAAGLDQEGEAS